MNREPARLRPTLQTVDRALEILLSFSEERTEWGVSEFAHEYGLSQSNAQRLMATLADRGFLRITPNRRYRLGPAVWRMSALWEKTGGLAALADPVLSDLSDRTGRTALFAIPDGTHIRVVAIVGGEHGPVWQHSIRNELFPAHAGAAARGYFAFLDPKERRRLLEDRPLGRYSVTTMVTREEIEALFLATAKNGYAYSDGEFDWKTRAIAVPVCISKRPVASVCLIESGSSQPPETLQTQLPLLNDASATLTRLLVHKVATSQRRVSD